MINRRTLLKSSAVAALAAPSLGALAQQSITLKFHTFMAPQSGVWLTMHKPWMEKVEKESGGRIKFEAYPWFTNKLLGGEVEVFGLGGSVRAPRITSGSGTTQAQGSLIAVNTMYNFMLRFPGETIQPYVGVGGGTSMGFLYNTSIQSGNVALSGSSGDVAFAYQFLGGVKTFVTKRLFLFGEYKYFGTKYSWDSEGAGNSKVKLDFQTHIVSGGLGWSF